MLSIKNEKPIFMQHGSLDCHLMIEVGKVYAIWGGNGVGKSTFFSYLKNNAFSDWEMSFLEQTELRPLGTVSLFHVIKVLRRRHAEKLEDTERLIDFFKFKDLIHRPINFLSGGQKQIAKIILCLAKKAKLYCLDEPFNNLDEEKERMLIQFLQEQKLNNKSFLVVDHDRSFHEQVVDQVFYFRKKDESDSYFLGT